MQRNTQGPVGKHNNRLHASPHHEVATDVKQMPIRPIIINIVIVIIIIIIIIVIIIIIIIIILLLLLLLLLSLLLTNWFQGPKSWLIFRWVDDVIQNDRRALAALRTFSSLRPQPSTPFWYKEMC